MRKYLAFLSVLLLAVFLSGCSLGSSPTTSTPVAPVKKPSSILKSVDGGKTWEFKSKTDSKINLNSIDVLSMSANPQNGQNIFVGTLKNGILKTEDGGENWSALVFPAEKVYGLVNDYFDGRIIYASGTYKERGKIFKSLNSGSDWDEIYTAPSDGPLIVALTNDKRSADILFAATSDEQLLKSTDAGVSWKNVYASKSPITKISIDSGNSNIIYINTQIGDFLTSRDGGKTFESSSIKGNVSFIATDPKNGGIAYAAGKAGLLKSMNGGGSWEELKTLGDPSSFPVRVVAVNPANSAEIIYGAGQAIYKSVDGGTSWMTSQLETEKNIGTVMYDANDQNIMYLGLKK